MATLNRRGPLLTLLVLSTVLAVAPFAGYAMLRQYLDTAGNSRAMDQASTDCSPVYAAGPPRLDVCFDQDSPSPRYVYTSATRISGAMSMAADLQLYSGDGSPVPGAMTQAAQSFWFASVQLRLGMNRFMLRASATAAAGEQLSRAFEYVVYRQEDPPAPPQVDPLPTTVAAPAVRVHGRAPPSTTVAIMRGSQEVAEVLADATTGVFESTVELPDPAKYAISARTINNRGTTSNPSPNQNVRFDPAPTPNSNFVHVDGRDGTGQVSAPDLSAADATRQLTIELGARSIHLGLTGELDPRSALAAQLLHGTWPTADVAWFLAGSIELSRRNTFDFAADWFRDTKPSYSMKAGKLTFSLDSNRELDYDPVNSRLEVSVASGDFLSSARDSVVLVTTDYSVETVDPGPTAWDGNRITWQGPVIQPLTIDLSLASVRAPTIFRLGVDDLWPGFGRWVTESVFALTLVIPFVWLLWLVSSRRSWLAWSDIGMAARLDRLDRLLRNLVTVGFLPLMFDVVGNAVTHGVDADLRSGWRPVMVAGILGLAGAVAGWRLQRTRWSPAYWTAIMLEGAGQSAVFSCAILFLILLYAPWLPSPSFLPLIWVLAFPVLAAMLVLWWRFGMDVFWQSESRSRTAVLVAGMLALVVISAELTWPLATALWDGRSEGGVQTVVNGVGNEYSTISNVTWMLSLIGVAMLTIEFDQRRWWRRQLILGVVLLLDFFPPAGEQQLGLPLSFVLTWLLARYVLFVSPGCAVRLARISDEVRRHRKQLVLSVIEWLDALTLTRSIADSLSKVSTSGTSVQDAIDSQAAAERHVAQLERRMTLRGGIPVRQVVLGISPGHSAWDDGIRAARLGAVLAVPILAVNYLIFFKGSGLYSGVAIQLAVAQDFVANVLFFVVLSFFFGYWFRSLQGKTGVTKGLRAGALLSVALIPAWLFVLSNVWSAVFSGLTLSEIVLLLATIGGVKFDRFSLRKCLGDRMTASVFVRMVGLPSLLTLGATGVAGVAASVAAAAAGEFVKEAAAQILSASGSVHP
jgi:hypothetical protein